MEHLGQEAIVVVLLILANGFFAAAEIALITARRGRLQQLADTGDRAAQAAIKLSKSPETFLPAVQIGITIVGTLAAAFGGAKITTDLKELYRLAPIALIANHPETFALATVVLSISLLEVLLGELVPKKLAIQNPAGLARLVALPMLVVVFVLRPFVWFADKSTSGILRVLGVKPNSGPELHREDIEQILDEGVTGGVLDPVERRVAVEAIRLSERTVRDIMQPRIDIDGIEIDTGPDEILGTVSMAGFTRLPVYQDNLDKIVGFVHVKDLLRQVHMGWKLDLHRLLRPAVFVPDSLPLDKLLVRFREQRTHMAVVLDEFGGTEGIVTLDAVLEELVGEIHDEHSRDVRQALVKRADGSLLVDGQYNLEDLLNELNDRAIKLPANRGFSTLAGLILDILGRLPDVGEIVEWNKWKLEIVDMDGVRIDRVLVNLPKSEAAEEPATGATEPSPPKDAEST